jgi:hypothetical protein
LLPAPFPIIVFGAAIIGFVAGLMGLAEFEVGAGHAADKGNTPAPPSRARWPFWPFGGRASKASPGQMIGRELLR